MGYYDTTGTIRSELLDEEAKSLAESFFIRNPRDPNRIDKRKSLSSAQLRRFFGEFRQLEKKVNVIGFEKVKPLIKMVKSKASYAANPDNRKIPESFKNFLIKNINEINTQQDFEAFMLHFEAVVGFFYGEGVSNN
jgi:CRISPR-associated protein Csm2